MAALIRIRILGRVREVDCPSDALEWCKRMDELKIDYSVSRYNRAENRYTPVDVYHDHFREADYRAY